MTDSDADSRSDSEADSDPAPRCRLCGARLVTGLLATDRRACCLNATPIAGSCPEHGPLGPHHVVEE